MSRPSSSRSQRDHDPQTAADAVLAPLAIVAATRGEVEPLRKRLAKAIERSVPGTERAWHGELAGRPVVVATCGVGTVAASGAAVGLALSVRPSVLLMTGIAGAYVGAFVPVGVAVAASTEFDLDAGVLASSGMRPLASVPLARGEGPDGPWFDTVATDVAWRDALAAACGTVPLPFATSDAVSGDLDVAAARAERSGASLESMEGFGAALACARLGLPFAEVRGVSNVAGVRDKAAWEVRGAIAAASDALLAVVRHAPD